MIFLNDLNPAAWLATIATLVICGSVLFLSLRDWMNHWRSDSGLQLAAPFYLGILCIVGAVIAYSPPAYVPRKTVVGSFQVIAVKHGRGGTFEYICVDSCAQTGGYTLSADFRAMKILDRGQAARRFRFVYLDHPQGNALSGVSLRLVGIADADTGQTLYEVDLSRHLLRMAVFLVDVAICFFTAGLYLFLAGRTRTKDPESEQEPAESKPATAEAMTSLHLGSGEDEHA
jgi:hypothetical protein